MKYILIIYLLITALLALEKTKIKVKQKADVVNVKMIIKSPGNRRQIDENFLTHILVTEANNIVYDLSSSTNFSFNPVFRLKYKYMGMSDTLSLRVKYSNGIVEKSMCKIKSSKGINTKKAVNLTAYKVHNYRENHPKIWKMHSVHEVLDALYESHEYSTIGSLQIFTPNFPPNGSAVPFEIKGNLPIESFIVFATKNPHVVVAIISTTPQSITNYSFKVRLKEHSEIIVIAKGKDGKLYKASNKLAKSVGLEYMKEQCLKGDVRGCNGLGRAYLFGQDDRGFKVTPSDYKSKKYFSMAADIYSKGCEENNLKQCYELGICYDQGRGRAKNKRKAMFFFYKAYPPRDSRHVGE